MTSPDDPASQEPKPVVEGGREASHGREPARVGGEGEGVKSGMAEAARVGGDGEGVKSGTAEAARVGGAGEGGVGTAAEQGDSSKGARLSVLVREIFGERPSTILLLVSPTLIGVALDVVLRHHTLRFFPPKEWLNYFGSTLVAAGFWGSSLWCAARLVDGGTRWGRALVVAWFLVFVLPFSFFAYGGQYIYFQVFRSYIARDTIRLGLELRGTVGDWMAAWLGKLWPAMASAVGMAAVALFVIRRAGPRLRGTSPFLPVTSFAMVTIALAMDFVETKGLQAAPPDSCFLHGVAGWAHERVTQKGATKGMTVRSPGPLPKDLPAPIRTPNVVLIVTESVRGDTLCSKKMDGCDAPFLNVVAPERTGFLRMTSQASGTFTACIVLWTGMSPEADIQAMHRAPTLWELAGARGYATSYFSSQNLRYRDFGVFLGSAGIGTLVSAAELGHARDPHVGAPDELAAERLLAWLRAQHGPTFSVLHLSNTHWPYRVDKDLTPHQPADPDPLKPDVSLLRNHYKNSVLMQERMLSRFLAELRAMPSWDDTVVFFVSDHGEQFREHGRLYHLNNLFEEEVHIPGFALFGKAALTDEEAAHMASFEGVRVYGIDIHGTILDLLGFYDVRASFAEGEKLRGRSLLRARLPRHEPAVTASTTSGVWVDNDPVYGIIQGDRKLISNEGAPFQCFDLRVDPAEREPQPAARCRPLFAPAKAAFPFVKD